MAIQDALRKSIENSKHIKTKCLKENQHTIAAVCDSNIARDELFMAVFDRLDEIDERISGIVRNPEGVEQ